MNHQALQRIFEQIDPKIHLPDPDEEFTLFWQRRSESVKNAIYLEEVARLIFEAGFNACLKMSVTLLKINADES